MKTQQDMSSYTFQVPTQATNLEPVFILEFSLNNQIPVSISHVRIRLNPNLLGSTIDTGSESIYLFDENGHCRFMHQIENQYFIKGELKINTHRQTEVTGFSGYQCFANMTYGQVNNEINYIKGTFKLIKEKEAVLCP